MRQKALSRLHLAAALVVVLAVVACGYVWRYTWQSQERLLAGTEEHIEQQSAQLTRAVTRQMSILMQYIDSTVIRLRDSLNEGDEGSFQTVAKEVLGSFPANAVHQIGFIDRHGYLIYSTIELREPIDLNDREHFAVHRHSDEDRLFISHPLLGRATNAWSIQFTRPLRRKGQFAGVVVFSLNPKYIADSLQLATSSENDVVAILRLDGSFVSRSTRLDQALGTSLPPSRPFVGADAPTSGTVRLSSQVDGMRRVYSWQRLNEVPLVVVVGLADAPILEPVERAMRETQERTLTSTVIVLLFAGGIAILLLRVERDRRSLYDSQHFLETVVENIPAMLFVKDATDLRFVRLNKAGEDLLGYARQDFIGHSDYDFFPPDEADFFTSRDRRVLSELSVLDIPQEPIETRFGPKILHTRKIGVADSEGRPRFLIGISIDITEREWLARLEQTRRLILETLASGKSLNATLAYVVGLIERHSPGALCAILLLEPDGGHLRHAAAPNLPDAYNRAVHGVAFAPQLGPDERAPFRTTRTVVEDVTTHPDWQALAEAARHAGLRSCWSEPLRAANGDFLGIFALYRRTPGAPGAHDQQLMEFAAETIGLVVERKRSEAELESYRLNLEERVAKRTRDLVLARDLAESANRAKSAFLSNMSHELRTPLNVVMGFSDLLRRDRRLDASQRENLNIIHRSGAHLLTLINDILEMVKIETGGVQVRREPFDLLALVGEIVGAMQLRATAKGLRLLFEPSAEVPRHIRSDETKLRQILMNLLDNAIKFTTRGEIALRLFMLTGRNWPSLSIEVEDSGIGIAADDRERIFDPFVQIVGDDAQKGTGLGLTINRQFVTLLGGRIGVSSQPRRGACFQVELPVEIVADLEPAPNASQEKEIVGLQPGQPEHRLLVVDDQPENALLLRQLLESVGFQVRIAEDGARGVEVFETWHPDFI
ncbi:ATP-binding protein [Accumulibacter sp.]|uniref:ATP-binding protein n=1 Tax=Accumulibacter sp. TaxID=2053492 RepID=UPI00260999E2|nr:ATP-binding protein [Accumulibacter sp.]